ncbi:uncharacterized protein GGS22DRAFT_151188 [Annulohypoxylon maeteangense]|uniref:uncharacterized protein n=1 Tax=Annulohypoxylon maeteangense TaxID=1927788 RepID=UPI0020076A71|nr:uncharacterized protein GGS22DRAFT_151188 [Annulohypoxylon maeteangense]KAI0890542.1 hypothetical protein GGS22DRAFT_151188 [Annulohypoxylon maeteangense]
MPAVAAIVNQAVAGDKNINLFYNTADAQLGMAFKNGTNVDDPQSAWAADATDYKGYIFNPSTIASDYYRGNQLVIGVTEPRVEEGKPTTNQISLLSPIYRKLAMTALQNKNVSMCSSGNSAWVYYLDGSAPGQMRLKEYNVENGNVSTFLQNQDVTLNCSLAAWYNPTTYERLVIYQEMVEGHLKEFNTVTRQSWDIDGTDNAKDLASMAISYTNGKAYLYYVDSNDNIHRVIKDESGWGEPRTVAGIPKVGTSQITVVAANSYNHIFYKSQESTMEDDFFHAHDPVQ